MSERTAIIYRLVSPSGNSYIGFTTQSLKRRWQEHLGNARRGIKTKLADAIRKYGPDFWTKEILLFSKNVKAVLGLESSFIQQYDSIQNGYNLCAGGDGRIGYPPTKDQRDKTRETMKKHRAQFPEKWINQKVASAKSNIARAYKWLVTFPDDHTEVIFNLRQFCREAGLEHTGLWRTQKTGNRYRGYTASPLRENVNG